MNSLFMALMWMCFWLTTLDVATDIWQLENLKSPSVKFRSSPPGVNTSLLNTQKCVVEREKVNEYNTD